MTAVRERLRASKEKRARDGLELGFQAGKKWAEDTAEYHELRALAQQPELDEDDADDVSLDWVPNAIGREDAREFWEEIGTNWQDDLNGFYVIGFQRGALDVWEDVKDDL